MALAGIIISFHVWVCRNGYQKEGAKFMMRASAFLSVGSLTITSNIKYLYSLSSVNRYSEKFDILD